MTHPTERLDPTSPENNSSGAESTSEIHLPSYTDRVDVPPELRDWMVAHPNYNPADYTSAVVLTTGREQGWADPEDPRTVNLIDRPSHLGPYKIDPVTGRPLNPMGRQGLAGRGDLGKFGPNHAADPIVIATDPTAGKQKILLIRRKDTGEWALPGGMVDPGERTSLTARRELLEEAGIDLAEIEGEDVFAGYVYDRRNTDNAWMETVATRFDITHTPEPQAGDDAAAAEWFSIDSIEALLEETGGLYASHEAIIRAALEIKTA